MIGREGSIPNNSNQRKLTSHSYSNTNVVEGPSPKTYLLYSTIQFGTTAPPEFKDEEGQYKEIIPENSSVNESDLIVQDASMSEVFN